ncbi:uncharacterized protein N7498_003366 [Penicillium cinerascens]|uniref:Uncharacterized protein n=1 Tax=Penicillium cinerascens TaxID=70096 RepID=A0A9W9N1W0_9EURO|nr:uncharacterized protein N7498_003366 [Penicillium cinerascens]KAJ5211720.1 hypothetical protein N7498_003366 [Penicillium cinerascens]
MIPSDFALKVAVMSVVRTVCLVAMPAARNATWKTFTMPALVLSLASNHELGVTIHAPRHVAIPAP